MKRLAKVFAWVLARRYDVSIKGKEVLDIKGPKLFLPNHQAEVDPVVLIAILIQKQQVAPMISAAYYNIPVFKNVLDLVGSVPVSDLDMGSRDTSVMKTISDAANKAFAKGDSILLYPAGHLCNQGYEKIANKQSAYNIVKMASDDLTVIGVRMSGFWGSLWSRAWIGVSPNFIWSFLMSVFWWFTNLIFFVPKRKIVFEFFDITKEAKEKSKTLKRREFNKYLEDIYNANGEEKIRYIRHHFLAPKIKKTIPKGIDGILSDNINEIKFVKIK